jgi:hypothetical protein
MTARVVGSDSNQKRGTAVCFVLMARCRVRQFSKTRLVDFDDHTSVGGLFAELDGSDPWAHENLPLGRNAMKHYLEGLRKAGLE